MSTENRLRQDYRRMVKDPLFRALNREPVTPVTENAYVLRNFEGLLNLNRERRPRAYETLQVEYLTFLEKIEK